MRNVTLFYKGEAATRRSLIIIQNINFNISIPTAKVKNFTFQKIALLGYQRPYDNYATIPHLTGLLLTRSRVLRIDALTIVNERADSCGGTAFLS